MRREAGLSLRELAAASGLATSTVHRVEQGTLTPTTATLDRIGDALGFRLRIVPEADYALSLVGLARSFRLAIDEGGSLHLVRMAAELVHRFERVDESSRRRMVLAEPPRTGDATWDAFIGGLATWLCVRSAAPTPAWATKPDRFLDRGWWVTPMHSMQAWEYAGTPVSFKVRGVYLHRSSLTNV